MPITRLNRPLSLAVSEFVSFWRSPSGGLALAVFLIIDGLLFYNALSNYYLGSAAAKARGMTLEASLSLVSQGLSLMGLIVMLVTPLVTMRAFSPHASGGHQDLLLAWPLGRLDMILGHYLGALASLCLLAVLSLSPYLVLLAMGAGDIKIILCAALGLFLLISAFSAIGLAVASMTASPLSAALGTIGVLAFFWAMGWAGPYLTPAASALAQGLSFGPRMARFAYGLIDMNDALYLLVLSACALLACRPFRA